MSATYTFRLEGFCVCARKLPSARFWSPHNTATYTRCEERTRATIPERNDAGSSHTAKRVASAQPFGLSGRPLALTRRPTVRRECAQHQPQGVCVCFVCMVLLICVCVCVYVSPFECVIALLAPPFSFGVYIAAIRFSAFSSLQIIYANDSGRR